MRFFSSRLHRGDLLLFADNIIVAAASSFVVNITIHYVPVAALVDFITVRIHWCVLVLGYTSVHSAISGGKRIPSRFSNRGQKEVAKTNNNMYYLFMVLKVISESSESSSSESTEDDLWTEVDLEPFVLRF